MFNPKVLHYCLYSGKIFVIQVSHLPLTAAKLMQKVPPQNRKAIAFY